MSSEIKADKWSPASGTSATIGDSGDTYTVPSGVTLNTSSATLTLPSTVITGQTEKSSLADADKFLISDSAASGALKYVQKSNLPSGSWTLLQTESVTGTPSGVNISSFSSDYTIHAVVLDNVRPSSDNDTLRHAFKDSGGSFIQLYNGGFVAYINESAAAFTDAFAGNPVGYGSLSESTGNGGNEGLSGIIYYDSGLLSSSLACLYWGQITTFRANNNYAHQSVYGRVGNTATNQIEFGFNSGNIAAGTFKLYGIGG